MWITACCRVLIGNLIETQEVEDVCTQCEDCCSVLSENKDVELSKNEPRMMITLVAIDYLCGKGFWMVGSYIPSILAFTICLTTPEVR